MNIAIIEDDKWYAEMIKYHVNLNPDVDAKVYENAADFFADKLRCDVVVMDYGLPDMEGTVLLNKLKSERSSADVVVVSAQEDVSTAIGLLKNGAFDYIVKDEDAKDRLWNSINLIREKRQLKERIEELEDEVTSKYAFSNYIKGNSAVLKGIYKLMEKACRTAINVSVTGETGTGKELVAKAIHYNSDRKKKKFVAVNVSAIPSELLESELFGHEKGAFTGANSVRQGRFEQAHQGTLFLDEIGDMPLDIQTRLLRVLADGQFYRVGGHQAIGVDVRIIAATHQNLEQLVQEGFMYLLHMVYFVTKHWKKLVMLWTYMK